MIMKRVYSTPACSIIQITTDVLTTSGVSDVAGNANINWGGAGNGIVRSPGHRDMWK